MGLSKDQRAMLRLLAQREEGYDDIAALMGISVDEVRARVRGALAELQSEDAGAGLSSPPASPAPSAPPVGPASPAGPVAAGDPPPPAVAEASSGAVPPAAPPAEEAVKPPARPAPRPQRPSRTSPRFSLPSDPRRLIELIGGALVVLLIALFATGAVDLGSDDSGPDTTTATANRSDESGQGGIPTAANPKFTQAVLEPMGGADARGLAQFGKVRKTAVLQVEAEGLEPTGPGEAYTVWLYRSPKLVLRVGAVRVTESGGIAAQFPIPTRLLGTIANRTFNQIDVSLTTEDAYAAEVARSKREKRLPAHIGESVLRGEITGPLVNEGS